MRTMSYRLEPDLTPEEFIDVLVRSTLAERRPVSDRDRIQAMLQHADIILTARFDRLLVGVSRAITDFAFCTYLSDLAVDERYQRQGIGRELIRRTHEAAGLHTGLVLLAAPKAQTYYPHVGMTRHESCWIIPRPPRPGENHSAMIHSLCEICSSMREVITPRGSRFLLCQLARTNSAFPKYPPQPVVRCAGYRPRDSNEEALKPSGQE